MTALALNHELARETTLLDRARDSLRALTTISPTSDLADIVRDLDLAVDRIDALRNLFDPLFSAEDRSAIDRLRVVGVVTQVVRAFQALMPRVHFDFSDVPESLRFPVGSFAEWSALLQNVLTNAWNAMLDADEAIVSLDGGHGPRAREWLRVSDTGAGLDVPLRDSDALFEPFERRLHINAANRSIAMGGQGLGLSIVRMIAGRRSARVAFVKPKRGFATTLDVSWKGAPQ